MTRGKFCSKSCASSFRNINTHREPWNKGLTKETDVRMAQISETMRNGHRIYAKLPRKVIFCKNCGEEITIVETSKQEFCSRKCVTETSWKTTREKRLKWIIEEPEKKVEHDRKVGVAQKGVPEKDWVKKQTSRAMTDFFKNNPEIGKASRRKQSAIRWEDPEHAKKCLSIKSPNRLEIFFLEMLDEEYPGEWQFVGNGAVSIGGKIPDYIHKYKKYIIELYGDYWHRDDDPQDRIDFFEKFGYSTLVVWGHSLTDTKEVIKMIDKLKVGGEV